MKRCALIVACETHDDGTLVRAHQSAGRFSASRLWMKSYNRTEERRRTGAASWRVESGAEQAGFDEGAARPPRPVRICFAIGSCVSQTTLTERVVCASRMMWFQTPAGLCDVQLIAQDSECGRVVGGRKTEGAATEDLVNILVTIRICSIEVLYPRTLHSAHQKLYQSSLHPPTITPKCHQPQAQPHSRP